jgi:hypothetical protein
MLEQAATPSGCNMLESNRRQHFRLQHAQTGCNIMLHFVKLVIVMVPSTSFLLHFQQSLKFFSAVDYIAKKIKNCMGHC